MNGTSLISGGSVAFNPGLSWHAVGTGAISSPTARPISQAEPRRHAAGGVADGWTDYSSGANVGFNPGPAWHASRTGDYNADGKADILWQNDNGTAGVVRLMDGTNVISAAPRRIQSGKQLAGDPQEHDLLV